MAARISPTKREKVFDKYDGHCSYCGRVIEFAKFQVDHKIPQCRAHAFKGKRARQYYNAIGESINSMANLMPSCRLCNHYKRSYSLEGFRTLMKTIQRRLAKVYIFKVAINYGIVKVVPFDGVFYFEKVEKERGKVIEQKQEEI